MNKLTVLAKNVDTYFIKRLTEEVGLGRVHLINPWTSAPVTKQTDIWVRTTAVYGGQKDLDYLESWQGKIINPLEALKRFRSKSSQYHFFEKQNIPCLPWLNLKTMALEEVLQVARTWNSTLLIKPDRGQGGWGIRTMELADLPVWWQQNDHDFLLQPYLEGHKELRVFFAKGMSSIILEREKVGEVVANFCEGGQARLSELPGPVARLIEQLIEKSGALYGAVDLFDTKTGPQILELNVCPGIEQLEKISGQNIMRQLLTNLGS